jgi:hypothetical protein
MASRNITVAGVWGVWGEGDTDRTRFVEVLNS